MKKIINLQVGLALLLAAAPGVSMATTLNYSFNDVFTNGSTVNSLTPAAPTPTNTAYQDISGKPWDPNPPTLIFGDDLRVGEGSQSSGEFEIQALFDTNLVSLTEPGDYVQLTVVFTNIAGCLTESGLMNFGLFNSGQVQPVPGGMQTEGTGNTANTTGGAQNWQGYVNVIAYNLYKNNQVNTRPAQTTPTTSVSQDLLITTGTSSTYGYAGGATVGSAVASTVVLTAGNTYTEVYTITDNGTESLTITNQLYSGPTATGTPMAQFGAVATNATFLTAGFDAFAFGLLSKSATALSNVLDVSSITVTSSATVITGPPIITLEPVPALVATNGSGAFIVTANGFDVTYQWVRNGTNLLNQGNISGATGSGGSSVLGISPVGLSDAGTNLYYVVVTGAGGYSTNSVTNSLTLVPGTNLVWTGTGNGNWDLTSINDWKDTNGNPQVFTYGDNVTFGNYGPAGGGGTVTLVGPYLSAASVTVSNNNGEPYIFAGSGSIAGPGPLIYDGSQQLTLNNVNTYTGGTIISNALAYLLLDNYAGFGTGPVTLVLGESPGTAAMEISATGSASTGIAGDLIVANDFTIQYDNLGPYSMVLLGNIAGTSGKTLTMISAITETTTNNRVRVYGSATTNNANIYLDDSELVWAPYNSTGLQVYNGVISGPGAVMEKGVNTYLSGPNTYSGGTFLVSGSIAVTSDSALPSSGPLGTGPIYLTVDSTTTTSGSGTLFAAGANHTLGNPIEYPTGTNNVTFIIGGTNNLTFTSPFALSGNDNLTTNAYTARTFEVTNGVVCTFSGAISDLTNSVSARYGLTLSGLGGVLALSATETYTGPTVISNGTLQVNGALNAASAVTVLTNGALAGTGTVPGPVTIEPAGALAPGGASIGQLTINNGVTNSGNIQVRVNRTGFISDNAVVSGALTNAGTGSVIVTNQGSALQPGDQFFLFNKPLTNGAAMAVFGGDVAWTNELAVNASIVVIGAPDIGVLLAAPASVAPAALSTNTITVTNIGPGSAYSIIVTDALPANATFVSANAGGTTNANAGQVVWNVSSLGIDTASNLTVIEKAGASGTMVNTASGISSAADPSPANNTATANTVIITTIIPTVSARLSSFTLANANVLITGTNGVNGGTYYLLESTSLAVPISQWTPVATNVVGASGANEAFTFSGTNVVTPNGAQQFYILSNTNN